MDGNTEPLIAVLGQPIAGNPSQFAIERGLRALDLDFRVTSFDVSVDDLEAALSGLEVLGYHGVLIDHPLMSAAANWIANKNEVSEIGAPIDCLFRDHAGKDTRPKLMKHNAFESWLIEVTKTHRQQFNQTRSSVLWLGARDDFFPQELLPEDGVELFTRSPNLEVIERTEAIYIAAGPKKEIELSANQWPIDDGSTLVIDLTNGHSELDSVRSRGYTVIDKQARRCGVIQQCLSRWTGQTVADSIIQEAIEEYLAV